MSHSQRVDVLYATYELVHELACQSLLDLLILYYEVEEFTTTSVLHHQVDVLLLLEYLVQLDDVGVVEHLKDSYFAFHSFNIGGLTYPCLF